MRAHRIGFCLALLTVLLSGWTSLLANAQDEGEPVTRLEPIWVTARPIIEGNRRDDYGSVTTVITEEQLDDLNAQDIETALRQTPGVNMSRFNPVARSVVRKAAGCLSAAWGRAGRERKSKPWSTAPPCS
ncbi:TonB-dependent receptor plug domain-containing protein [Desulfosarcina cetonica]|uniref:TonB-dependent receptor plug domain-containing protein n=1 Tax=Desulfosarcina cetonica TaxID=90730 RepID=UPI0006D1F2BF|nr:TonB-dependent receptor plug domain-containing protein [Desulfosarcina cetonica]